MRGDLRLTDIPDTLSEGEFWATFGRVEHEGLDFKRGAPELTTAMAAMAMSDGGLIVLGISDDRRLEGAGLSQRTFDRVMKAANAIGVDVQLKELLVESTSIVVIAVPQVRQRIVTTPDGRLVRRVGSDNQPLLHDALARFVRAREERPAEEEPIPNAQTTSFDLDLVNEVLSGEGRPSVGYDDLWDALVDLGVAMPAAPPAGPMVLKAAAVLFALDPRSYVAGAAVQLVRRTGVAPGPGPSASRQTIAGPLSRVVDQVLEYVNEHTVQLEAVVGQRRERLPEYPIAVLREAVLNALAHRDYGLVGTTVDVTLWDDRIEIQSPGPLPGHISLDNMREEHYSRNPRIMRTLKSMALVEEYGEGVDRMYREMEARLMEPPLFLPTSSSVTITLRNRAMVGVEDQVWLSLLGQFKLSVQERRLLVAVRREGQVTRRRVRALLPDKNVETLLAGAVTKGLLIRVGTAGGGAYQLSDEVVLRAGSTGVEAQSRKRQMLLDEMRRRGSLSSVEGGELLGEDRVAVRDLLNDLVAAGLAVAEGRTRARRYHAVL